MTTNDINTGPEDRQEKVTLQQSGGFEHQERILEDMGAERQLFSERVTRFVILVFSVLDSVIGLRVLLKLIAANPSNLFAHFIYQMTDLFLKPFANLVSNPASGGMVLEITSLIAMLVFGLVCWAIVQLVRLALFRTRTRTVAIYNKEHR